MKNDDEDQISSASNDQIPLVPVTAASPQPNREENDNSDATIEQNSADTGVDDSQQQYNQDVKQLPILGEPSTGVHTSAMATALQTPSEKTPAAVSSLSTATTQPGAVAILGLSAAPFASGQRSEEEASVSTGQPTCGDRNKASSAATGTVAVMPSIDPGGHSDEPPHDFTRLDLRNEAATPEEVPLPSEGGVLNQRNNHGILHNTSISSVSAATSSTLAPPTSGRSEGGTNARGAKLPVAEEYHDFPLISAEMVVPSQNPIASSVPVVYQVDIDAEQDERNDVGPPREATTMESREKAGSGTGRSLRRFLIYGAIALVLMTVIVTMIVVFVEVEFNTTSSSNPPIASFPYPCYTSTLDLLRAQIEAPKDVLMDPLIICPGTRIPIGTFRNPSRNDFNISGGDYPISILRPNVTIQCGLDGERENHCILEGGLAHVVTQSEHYHPDYGYIYPTENINGFILRGITFTGQISGTGVFGGIPVALSHPGKGIRFEDCAWIDLTATKRVIAVGRNYFMELVGLDLADLSVELTLTNCLFDNVIYEEEFIVSIQQAIHIEKTHFHNVELSALLSAGCGMHPNGCRNLLFCRPGGPSICSISDLCVENFQITGAAPIVISHETVWSSSGTNTWQGPFEFGDPSFVVNGTDALSGPSFVVNGTDALSGPVFAPPSSENSDGVVTYGSDVPRFCDLGVAKLDTTGASYQYSCLESRVFEPKNSGSCAGNS